jgi:hypothetical protein
MRRAAPWIFFLVSTLAATGCCNGPYGRLQDGWLWNNARLDYYPPGYPPPPKTTPPGPVTSAALPLPAGVN